MNSIIDIAQDASYIRLEYLCRGLCSVYFLLVSTSPITFRVNEHRFNDVLVSLSFMPRVPTGSVKTLSASDYNITVFQKDNGTFVSIEPASQQID